MKNLIVVWLTMLVSHFIYSPIFSQNRVVENANDAQKEILKREVLKHYEKYNIADIRAIENDMSVNLPVALGRLQNMLNTFYQDHPARPVDVDDLDFNSPLKNQRDPDYKLDKKNQANLDKLREKQAPHLIKNAPNIFELHLAMARGLRDAEKKGVIFTKNPFRSSFHFITALRYRTLKLTPEVWIDADRLNLLNDPKQNADADNYIKTATDLSNARQDYDQTKRRLYVQEDELIPQFKDPGNNPAYKTNQQTLSDLENKISLLEQEMKKQDAVYEGYAESWNRDSANVLLEFADVVNSIDETIRDREKILNSAEYYRSNYDGTFKQNWKLESRKMAYVDLLETASLLDPENPITPELLAREYKSAGDDSLAISSFEKSLAYNERSTNKLTPQQLASIYHDLGGLYYNTRRYVDSAFYYEKAYELDKSEELEYQLAKIHVENTGNYERARELIEKLITKVPVTANIDDQEKVAGVFKYSYNLNSYLSYIYEKTGEEKLTLETLKKSASIHSQFENLVFQNYEQLRKKEKIMFDSRLKFNQEPNEINMQAFYQSQQDYQDQKNMIQRIESMRKSINFKETYFSLARHLELNHDILGAIEAYRTSESFGLAPDEARREIFRLQKKYLN
ncbi:MAG: hypothetical protein OEV78_12250 [Spirochaetia bacterium]|nr:hypothetical protein [Spirochaetia bacterium]